jgi:hypothetical protein
MTKFLLNNRALRYSKVCLHTFAWQRRRRVADMAEVPAHIPALPRKSETMSGPGLPVVPPVYPSRSRVHAVPVSVKDKILKGGPGVPWLCSKGFFNFFYWQYLSNGGCRAKGIMTIHHHWHIQYLFEGVWNMHQYYFTTADMALGSPHIHHCYHKAHTTSYTL